MLWLVKNETNTNIKSTRSGAMKNNKKPAKKQKKTDEGWALAKLLDREWIPKDWLHLSKWPSFSEMGSKLSSYFIHSDFSEDDKNCYLRIELPGVKKKDIKLAVDDNLVRISGSYIKKTKNKEESFSFNKAFTAPKGIKVAKIEATHEDGVLLVTMPKDEKYKPRSVDVK